ncbi:MAG: type II secretion system F family protein [Planctomycetota bacterium]|jgi:general secretion pathway protein F/type IV pilus assembly protein PilC
MGIYQYIARTTTGEEITGSMQADSEIAVVRTLDERKLYTVRVDETRRVTGARRMGRIRIRDLGVLYGQLSDLLRAGVPMLRALETLSRAAINDRLGVLIVEVRDSVSAGKTLADAMMDHPGTFSALHAAMVRAGERAGFLEDVLQNLAEFLERQDELRSKVRGSMIYPMVLVTLGTVAMLFILMVLVPKFEPFFSGIALPTPTRVLFALSSVLTHHRWLLLGAVVLIVIALRALLRSEWGRDKWERLRLKLPIFGRVIRTVSITRFCRILGTMLANGVPILQALEISKDASGSAVLSDNIENAAENVRAGEPLAEPLNASGLFPAEIIEMISVAEESNQLERVLVQIADSIERRTNRQVDAAVRLVEPLILVIIAVVIGFVAVGLMYPIFMMSQTLR